MNSRLSIFALVGIVPPGPISRMVWNLKTYTEIRYNATVEKFYSRPKYLTLKSLNAGTILTARTDK